MTAPGALRERTDRGLGGADGDGATIAFAGSADMDDVVIGVDVVPGQSGCFAGSQPEVQHGHPHRLEPGPASGVQKRPGLVGGHRAARLRASRVGGEFDDGGDVGGHETATLRPGECLGEGGSQLDQRAARQTGISSALEGGLDVVRSRVPVPCRGRLAFSDLR